MSGASELARAQAAKQPQFSVRPCLPTNPACRPPACMAWGAAPPPRLGCGTRCSTSRSCIGTGSSTPSAAWLVPSSARNCASPCATCRAADGLGSMGLGSKQHDMPPAQQGTGCIHQQTPDRCAMRRAMHCCPSHLTCVSMTPCKLMLRPGKSNRAWAAGRQSCRTCKGRAGG